jgi:hypothetical protein
MAVRRLVRLTEREALPLTAPEFNSATGSVGQGHALEPKRGMGDAIFVQLLMGFLSLIYFLQYIIIEYNFIHHDRDTISTLPKSLPAFYESFPRLKQTADLDRLRSAKPRLTEVSEAWSTYLRSTAGLTTG